MLLIFEACPPPEDGRAVALGVEGEYAPYLHIPYHKIYYARAGTEYSTDDEATWTACPGSIFDINLDEGDRVWIRDIDEPADTLFLGEVKATGGKADFLAWEKIYAGEGSWEDKAYGYPGQKKKILFYFDNIGTRSDSDSNQRIRLYLSGDRTITSSDTLLRDIKYTYNCPVGEVFGGQEEFTVPSVPYGTYYIGCIIDATNVIAELNEDNNTTPPACTAEFHVQDPDANTGSGAFKVVNSWGTTTSWQNVGGDGHYWITYEVMKKQQMMIYYFYNDFSHVYKPTIVAVFRLTHPQRNRCRVVAGLGNPSSPYMEKELQLRDGDDKIYSGAEPFPANDIVLDISEFAPAINDFDLFLSVENRSTIDNCMVGDFSAELYTNYDDGPPGDQSFTAELESLPYTIAPLSTGTLTLATKGMVTVDPEQILPLTRSASSRAVITEGIPPDDELRSDMKAGGVFREGVTYNIVTQDGHGTGYRPPTESQWKSMKKLRGVSPPSLTRGVAVDQEADHSATQYFPPVGEQGDKGSCACFVMGYYITTFNEAKEHSWDLSGASWTGGAPDAGHRQYIFSPDFLYHQINEGLDDGSSMLHAASMAIRMGCSSWLEMPYELDDYTIWPSEAAFREAARYRGREVGNHYWEYAPCGYFIIYTDADVNMLKHLIASGYCVGTSIHVEAVRNPNDFYYYLDDNDVFWDDSVSKFTDLNHAQTIVGFKDGTAWNPSNPGA